MCESEILERSKAAASKDLRKAVQALARVPHSLARVRRSSFNTTRHPVALKCETDAIRDIVTDIRSTSPELRAVE